MKDEGREEREEGKRKGISWKRKTEAEKEENDTQNPATERQKYRQPKTERYKF